MPEEPHAMQRLTLEEIVSQDTATALYLPLAERLRERGQVEEAIRLCEERRQRPGSGVGDHIVLGRCYLADGRLGNAKAEFEAAVALDRENVVALKALAGIHAHEGGHVRAADLYRAVCRVDPGDLESQNALHQITSGEYPEVRPPDVIVGQGETTWRPVRLPREEERLGEIALGLRTIETFEAREAAPATPAPTAHETPEPFATGEPAAAGELSLDDLESAPAPAAPVARFEPEPAPLSAGPGPESGPVGPPPSIGEAPEREAPKGQNRSAFEEWLRRLGGAG